MNTLNFHIYSFAAYIIANVQLNNYNENTFLIRDKALWDKSDIIWVLFCIAVVIAFGSALSIIIKHIFEKKITSTDSAEYFVYYTFRHATVVLLCIFFIFYHIITISKCISGSMEPTVMTGDFALGNRLAYTFDEPKRGDVIDFYYTNINGVTESYLKRVIGIPGDTITFKDGFVFINGQLAIEEYLDKDVETNCIKSFTVPEGYVFVLGDNRENSRDSRMWIDPYVKIENIISKIIVVY